jgi:Ca2+-binding EF-hand superfamily protein|tara:strand:+ start:100 stop:441 length:342 start_codon:yes stop_codon:yes gene_type:complete
LKESYVPQRKEAVELTEVLAMLVKILALFVLLGTSVRAVNPVVGKDEAKNVFQIIDANGDGKISPLELRSFLRAMGSPQTLWETRVLLDYGDTNGNGQFDEDEYRKLLKGFGV